MKRELLVKRWLVESIPFPARIFKQLIEEFFHNNALVKKELRIGGKLVDLSDISCPTLAISNRGDVVAPPESASALLDHISSRDEEFIEVSGGDAGHIDIIVGDEVPEFTWPKIALWQKERSV